VEEGDPFSLILTDVQMPQMDGFEFAAKVTATPQLARPLVLMLTSSEHQGDATRCREMGIPLYLTKPVARADLRAAVVAALGLSAQPYAAHSAPVSDPLRSRVGSTLRILLTEDNVVNQRLALRILQKEGHNVVVAGNGREALEKLSKSEFDVVLMDVQMPDMDGFEATAAIRKTEIVTKHHMPVIAMTAHAMTGDRERCLAAGMDDYVSKPIRASALLDICEKYSGLAQAQVVSLPITHIM
jgi:CheY-like chemotaxis protein